MLRTLCLSAVAGSVLFALPALAQTAPAKAMAQPAPSVAADNKVQDPWEGANRSLYKVNKGIDRAVIRPTTVFYHHALPHPVREGAHNVLYNLGEPVTFLNNVVQLRPAKAGKTLVRFVVNSTVGIAGIFDVTGANGMPREPSGFDDTLQRYGAPNGPYIFLPVFGPSSVRDLTGRVVDVVTDPFTWINYSGRTSVTTTRTVVAGLDKRDQADPILKDVNRTATDPYATLRSAFLQHSEQTGAAETDVKALPDFGPEPGAPAASKPVRKPKL